MIDSNINVAIMYESWKKTGYAEGYIDCKKQMKEIIEAMAYEIATYRYPKQYEYDDDQLEIIMSEFGYTP